MVVLVFAVAVVVSLVDPLLAIAYVSAGVFARDWRMAAICGPIAGMAMLVLLALLLGGGWQPKAYSVFAQLTACLIGAVTVRSTIDLVQRLSAGVPGNSA